MVKVRDHHGSAPGPAATGGGTSADTSTGDVVAQASRQISELVRQELALAKAELADKGKNAGHGAGLFGGAGAIAFYGGGSLVSAVIAGLAVVWPVWAAALVVGVVLLAAAAVLGLAGRKRLSRATPVAPTEAAASVREDVHEIKDHLHGRQAR